MSPCQVKASTVRQGFGSFAASTGLERSSTQIRKFKFVEVGCHYDYFLEAKLLVHQKKTSNCAVFAFNFNGILEEQCYTY